MNNDEILTSEELGEKPKEITRLWKEPNGYIVRCGKHYKVKVIDRGEYRIYKFIVSQKNAEGKYEYGEKSVKFKQGAGDMNIKDGDIIEPLSFYERWYYSEKYDPNHFNPQFYLVITEWKILKSREEVKSDAIDEYNVTIEMDDLPF